MVSDRGWYLVAVAVLALGLSNSLANTHSGWLQTLTGRSVATAERLSGQAERYLAMAQVMLGQGQSGFGSTQAVIGRMQARLGLMQANLARHQADITRMEAENIRVVALPPLPAMPRVRVACPRVVVQVSQ